MIAVVIKAEDPDGNDAMESQTMLQALPSIGHSVEVWIDAEAKIPHNRFDDEVQKEMEEHFWSSEPVYLDVKAVVHSTYDPSHIEVWVSSDGVSDLYLRRVFLALDRKEQP